MVRFIFGRQTGNARLTELFLYILNDMLKQLRLGNFYLASVCLLEKYAKPRHTDTFDVVQMYFNVRKISIQNMYGSEQ